MLFNNKNVWGKGVTSPPIFLGDHPYPLCIVINFNSVKSSLQRIFGQKMLSKETRNTKYHKIEEKKVEKITQRVLTMHLNDIGWTCLPMKLIYILGDDWNSAFLVTESLLKIGNSLEDKCKGLLLIINY